MGGPILGRLGLTPPHAWSSERTVRAARQVAVALQRLLCAVEMQREPASAQIGLELLSRKRLRIEKALGLLAALVEQERRLRAGLDPFRDHLEPEIVRHRDERADDRRILGIVGDLGDEDAV